MTILNVLSSLVAALKIWQTIWACVSHACVAMECSERVSTAVHFIGFL